MTVWLASWPRSGNTMLRQMLWSGWGLLSGSIYAEDLGDNLELIRACGHVELKAFTQNGMRQYLNRHDVLMKTHEPTPQEGQTVYMIRDGRRAAVSYWHWLNKEKSLESIIRGQGIIGGNWSQHVIRYIDTANIAVQMRYEAVLNQPDIAIAMLTKAFGEPEGDPMEPLRNREDLAEVDGRWVRGQSDWVEDWSEELDALFWEHNREAMERFYPELSPGI